MPEFQKMIVFGSIHRGEERHVADIIDRILKKFNDVEVVIAPRSLDKTNIYSVLRSFDIQYTRVSYLNSNKTGKVLIVDRYGVLTEFYRKCMMAFVGGSLVPAGGQNPIEPAAFKKVVIYGKFNWDFEEEWKRIKEAGGGFEVNSFEELFEKIKFLLEKPDICIKMGEAAFKVVMENKGATEEMFNFLLGYIKN